jgi:hypothetical protein
VLGAAALAPAAKLAKLRHVSGDMPAITRHKARNGFAYRLPDGHCCLDLQRQAAGLGDVAGIDEITPLLPILEN